MNRGSKLRADLLKQVAIPSMRPRFMNRGSAWDHFRLACASQAFNEAPIHESGKRVAEPQAAQAHSPSMRPRFMNRGSNA